MPEAGDVASMRVSRPSLSVTFQSAYLTYAGGTTVVDSTRAMIFRTDRDYRLMRGRGPSPSGISILLPPHHEPETGAVELPAPLFATLAAVPHSCGAESSERLERILAAVARQILAAPTIAPLSRGTVRAALLFLSENYRHSIRLSHVAHAADLSEFHMSRTFSRDVGVSMRSHLNRLRVRASLPMLLDRTRSIADVALAVGYATHSQYDGEFRKEFRFSPKDYRNLAARDFFTLAAQLLD